MNIPVTVIRTGVPAYPAEAFLLPDAGAHRLGDVIAALSEGVPQVFRIRDACLVVPPTVRGSVPPGLIRLRRVADHYFIPVDGELSPAILPDEFPGLTRGGGLVHLASGLFAFDPSSPLPVSAWLRLPPRGTGDWTPFPAAPADATALRLIERPSPPAAVLEILGGGEPEGYTPLADSGPAAEEARPPASSIPKRLVGGAALGLAGAMAWLGRQFGLGGLARAGADLARRAVGAVPRLSEKIVGEQEAALRELLRQLRSGDAERALKRAPIAVADPDRPAPIAGGATLSERDIGYSFAELLRGGGASSAWVGGGDVWAALQAEYRRLAEEAVKRGDYRRAAYLLGVLLRDLRGAANVLTAGGRDRDAALLLRDRLNDPSGAAAAFERAGDFDEAVRLYVRTGEDVKAGDLLRRVGEEARAEASFRLAAGKLARRHEYRNAGDLIGVKLGLAELAHGYYREGWEARRADALDCGELLLDAASARSDGAAFEALLDEGTARFAPPSYAEAGRFFNRALRSAPALPPDRGADLRDRVRLFFAEHLRAGGPGKANPRIGPLFDGAHGWTASLRRDAGYAAAGAAAPQIGPAISKPRAEGTVRAVAHAPDGGVVFIGTADAVTAWYLGSDRSARIAHSWKGELVALGTDRKGTSLYTLVDGGAYLRLTVHAINPANGYMALPLASADIPCENADYYLQPLAFDDAAANFIALAVQGTRKGYHAQMLLAGSAGPLPEEVGSVRWIGQACGLLWDWADDELTGYRRLDKRGGPSSWAPAWSGRLGWTPASFGHRPIIDCATLDDTTLVIAGITGDGGIHRSEVTLSGSADREMPRASGSHPLGYTAVALLGGSRLAVARGKREIRFLRALGGHLVPLDTPVRIASAASVVYLGHHAPTRELIAVFEDGTTLKFPVPTRN